MDRKYLGLNDHAVGIILKELVRRAIVIARRQVLSFEVGEKMGYGGDMDDVFTSADKLAQESYVKSLRECFPDIGIIGEEESLSIPAKKGRRAFFTIDPIDGTKAYIRRQSHGIGSMVSLVIDGVVEAAYVGDVNAQEIFGYRPGLSSVWRITHLDVHEKLDINPKKADFFKSGILLRERENKYSKVAQKTVGLFKTILIDGGSVGTWAARLWKREVGALVLAPSWETPWDWSPVVGISLKLGYVFLKPSGEAWVKYQPIVEDQKLKTEHDTLIIHKNHLGQLKERMTKDPELLI